MKGRTVSGLLLAGVLLLAAIPEVTYSDVYTYKDSKGTVAYVDDLGKIPSRYRSQAKSIDDSQSVSIVESAVLPAGKVMSKAKQPVQSAPTCFTGTIEVYMTSWCPVCKDAESYLKKMKYPYVAYDIEKDKSAEQRANGYPGNGVPLIIIGKNSMRGFFFKALEERMKYWNVKL